MRKSKFRLVKIVFMIVSLVMLQILAKAEVNFSNVSLFSQEETDPEEQRRILTEEFNRLSPSAREQLIDYAKNLNKLERDREGGLERDSDEIDKNALIGEILRQKMSEDVDKSPDEIQRFKNNLAKARIVLEELNQMSPEEKQQLLDFAKQLSNWQ